MSHLASVSRPRRLRCRRRHLEQTLHQLPILAFALIMGAVPGLSAEVDRNRILQCRVIADGLERLSCFDALTSPRPAAAAAGTRMYLPRRDPRIEK